jgi:hypothetical protein
MQSYCTISSELIIDSLLQSDSLTGGCPVALPQASMKPYPMDWITQLHQPHNNGRLHFCSTEIADEFRGYMEGACRSGIAAANNILVNLLFCVSLYYHSLTVFGRECNPPNLTGESTAVT